MIQVYVGELCQKIKKELKDQNMSDKWECYCLTNKHSNRESAIHILPKIINKRELERSLPIIQRSVFSVTSLAYKYENGMVVMRRGFIKESASLHTRNIEEKLASNIIQTVKFHIDGPPAFTTIFYSFTKMGDPTPDMCRFMDKYENIIRREKELMTNLNDYFFDESNNSNIVLNCEESGSLQFFLDEAMLLAYCLTTRKSVLIEDSPKINISFILCSLIKMIMDNGYLTVEGYLSILQRDWQNFGYDFILMSIIDSNDKDESLLPYKVLYLCTSYLQFLHPEKFEFDRKFLELINFYVTTDVHYRFKGIVYSNIFHQLSHLSEKYRNHDYDPSITFYQEYSDSMVFHEL